MHSTTLTLGWAVWQPFDPNQSIEDEQNPTQVSLELKAGPGFKPTIIPNSAHNACYQVYNNNQLQIRLYHYTKLTFVCE